MTVDFVKDVGFRLRHQGRSLILASLGLGRIGERLSDKQIAKFAGALDSYESELRSRNGLQFKRQQLTPLSCEQGDDQAYKFTDDAGLGYWLKGEIRLSPPATYHSIENVHARDPREGLGTVHLQGLTRFATVRSQSGFDSLVICASSDARLSERTYRMEKFGGHIVKIHRATEFAARIAKLSGATSFLVRDIFYSDVKTVRVESPFPESFAGVSGSGDLTHEALAYVAEHWLDKLIGMTDAVSIFTKPLIYRLERERRFQFAFQRDMPSPAIVADKTLVDFLEVIS